MVKLSSFFPLYSSNPFHSITSLLSVRSFVRSLISFGKIQLQFLSRAQHTTARSALADRQVWGLRGFFLPLNALIKRHAGVGALVRASSFAAKIKQPVSAPEPAVILRTFCFSFDAVTP